MERLKTNDPVTYKNKTLQHFKGRIVREVASNPQRKIVVVRWEIEGVGEIDKPELEQNLLLAGKLLEE